MEQLPDPLAGFLAGDPERNPAVDHARDPVRVAVGENTARAAEQAREILYANPEP